LFERADIGAHFIQDLNSKAGQALAADIRMMKLKWFEELRLEFLACCQQLGLKASARSFPIDGCTARTDLL
jgi:hypothetical protein